MFFDVSKIRDSFAYGNSKVLSEKERKQKRCKLRGVERKKTQTRRHTHTHIFCHIQTDKEQSLEHLFYELH